MCYRPRVRRAARSEFLGVFRRDEIEKYVLGEEKWDLWLWVLGGGIENRGITFTITY